MRSPGRDRYCLDNGLPLDPPTCEMYVPVPRYGWASLERCGKPAVNNNPLFPRCAEHDQPMFISEGQPWRRHE